LSGSARPKIFERGLSEEERGERLIRLMDLFFGLDEVVRLVEEAISFRQLLDRSVFQILLRSDALALSEGPHFPACRGPL